MTGQPRRLEDILTDRLETAQSIAAANVEHLRLSQIAGGLMVLDMKAERDGTANRGNDDERRENFRALERSMERISALEDHLRALDEELEAQARENDR